MRAARALVAVGLAVGSLVGCGDEPAPCGLKICDVSQADCQRAVAISTACLRGATTPEVPVRLVPRAQYIEEQAAAPPDPAEEQSFLVWNHALAILGLAQPETTWSDAQRTKAEAAGSFYSNTDKAITLLLPFVTDPSSGVAVSILAHQYLHAIQDAAFDTRAFELAHATDFDRGLAAGAMLEGEATFVGDLTKTWLFGDDPASISWSPIFDAWKASSRRAAIASPSPALLAGSYFHFPYGTAFVEAAWANGGWAAVDGEHDAPPTSARQVMAGFGSPDTAEELGSDAVPVLEAPFQYLGSRTGGSWLLDQLLARANPDGGDVPPAVVQALTADELSIFRDTGGSATLVAWRFRLDSPESARALERSINFGHAPDALVQEYRVEGIGDRDVVLLAASQAGILGGLPNPIVFQARPAAP